MMKELTPLSKKEMIAGWCYLFIQTFILPVLLVLINILLAEPLSDAQVNFLFFIVNFLCAALIFHRYLKEEILNLIAAPWKVLRFALSGFVLYYVTTIGIGILIQYLYPAFTNANDSSVGDLVREDFTLTAVGTILLVPPVEELLYRTLLFGSVRKRSRILAYIVNIIIFGAAHIVGYIGIADPISLLLSFLQYAPAAFFLCWAYEHSGSIFAPMLMHIAVNLIGISLMR